MRTRQKLMQIEKSIKELEKKVLNLETIWKFDLLEELDIKKDDMTFEGFDSNNEFVVSDRIIDFQDFLGNQYAYRYYKIIVNKKEVINLSKDLVEEHFI